MNEVLKPDLVSVVTGHVVYFCVFPYSEIFKKNARKFRVGHGQFDAGVSGLIDYKIFFKHQPVAVSSLVLIVFQRVTCRGFFLFFKGPLPIN